MISIAIDGPAGAGKSTLARALAKKINFIYVDTGALYRAIGVKFLNLGYNTDLNCDIASVLSTTQINIKFIDGEQHVYLDNADVSEEIRSPQASMMASAVSAKPEVRAFLLEMQRKLAKENNVIMDGRDIGTVVLPNANVKIFLTADPKIRAERRYKELIEKGKQVTFDEVLADMLERDYNDSHRAAAPLKPAEDATHLDTTGNTFEQSRALVLRTVKERIGL